MDKIKSRSEIESKDKWSIELIYKNEDEYNNDIEKVKLEINKLIDMIDDFSSNSTNFKNFFLQDEIVSRLLDKLLIYSHCRNDEDISNSTYQELREKVTNLYTEYKEKTSSVIPKITEMDKEVIYKYIEEQDELKDYKHFFDTILQKKEHTLSKEEEKVISAYSPVLGSSNSTYSYLTNVDMDFGKLENEDGKEIDFNESNYSVFIESKDRNIRKNAFTKLFSTYSNFKNTLTSTYSNIVNYDSITSRLRNYNSSIEMYLEHNKIPVTLYNNLISVVRDNLPTLYEYYDLKKKILNLDEIHLYDLYVKVVKDNNKNYSFDEAKELVINALSVYGDDYINVLKTAFTDRWIDIYPNKSKRGGAYSTGSYDTLPYVLLNYTNTYNDVSTIAHELGHSMHSYYTNKNNPYITADYPIFLAEIASTTNELLLSHYMFENSNSREEKLSILNEKMDLIKATIFRQTMFAEFEKKVHDYVDSSNVLTSDYLCNLYYQLNKDYFGDGVVVDDLIKYEWSRIPHFYSSFYVYQYATSLSISFYVAKNIINNTPGFKEKYIKFLSSGGRDYPLEVLKIIDVDLNDTKVFESAMEEFKDTLQKFKKIYNEK